MNAPGTTATHPDWETLKLELHCPRCGYNLRGLPQPRCPECGLEFEWERLIASAQEQASSPLFEYQWRRRPVQSFFLTLWRAVLPWRLWTPATPTPKPQVVPLLVLMALAVLFGAVCRLLVLYIERLLYIRLRYEHWDWSAGLQRLYVDMVAWPALGYLITAVFVGAVALLFRQTINRYRLRAAQVMRVVALSWIALVFWGLAFETAEPIIDAVVFNWRPPPWQWRLIVALGNLAPYVFFGVGLCAGFTTYLRVRRGWLIGATSVALFVLFVAIPSPLLTAYLERPWHAWSRIALWLWPGLAESISVLLWLIGVG